LVSAVTPLKPTKSPSVDPVSELNGETSPDLPMLPFAQVTAPTPLVVALLQLELATT